MAKDTLIKTHYFWARAFTEDDLPLLMDINNDPVVKDVRHDKTNVLDYPAMLEKRQQELSAILDNQKKYGWSRYLFFTPDGTLLGHAGFFPVQYKGETAPELGIMLLPSSRSKSLGGEIAKACIEHLFTKTDASLMVATIMDRNNASNRMKLKLDKGSGEHVNLGGDSGQRFVLTKETYHDTKIALVEKEQKWVEKTLLSQFKNPKIPSKL